ncbi:hypothetical protein ES703_94130 [subsurface metagenome]
MKKGKIFDDIFNEVALKKYGVEKGDIIRKIHPF